MAKRVVGIVKVRIPGGEATPAPPLGPALGQNLLYLIRPIKVGSGPYQHIPNLNKYL